KMKYFTRPRVRREYKWRGQPLGFNRKLKTYDYGSLAISVEGLPRTTIIIPGQHILIEGDDEDNPYVAKVVRLFGDESGKMKALVQWFVRVSEVPLSKLKLLGREPHPQEVFYYQGRSCDDEVNVESILQPVQVKHLDAAAPFPNSDDKDTLYVKLSWDSKAFRVVAEPASASSLVPHATPSLPPSPPCSSRRALPTPDPAVMCRASLGEVSYSMATMSTGKASAVESLHSATKLSASKCLSAKRRNSAARMPGVRKKLELNSECLRQAFKTQKNVFYFCILLGLFLHVLIYMHENIIIFQLHHLHFLLFVCFVNRAEDDCESSPVVAAALRSSQRKSALLVSSRIRKQLNLLDNQQDLNSDGEDEDEFVPSKRELKSSSEEDEDDGEEEGLDSDEEIFVKKGRHTPALSRTPRSKQKTHSMIRRPRKTPSKKIIPGTPQTARHATPTIPSRSLPARQPANVLEEARARLHVSSVPESLPCREQEFQDIYSFVESKIIDGTGGCMYISGVPGTGKTATVHEVMRCLQHAADVDEIPTFHFIEINGMKMTDPHQAYVQILQNLTGQKATADHAAALLEKRFTNPAPRKETTVLLVDELDLLWTRKQNVMYNLFNWPTQRHARLVVLTIANTMDLPERIMINRVASRLGLTRMSFQPYSFKQLQQIIMSRLNKVKAFEEDALQLVSRKVAALSGDARRCLDICRRATEICEHSATNPSATGLVGMNHVMDALNEMFSSAYITAIKCASMQEQLFLRAVIAEFRRLGLEEATFQQVFVQHQALCRVEGLQPISVSEGLAVCQRLGACRLLLLEPSRLGVLQRIRLNVSQDDVLFALKAD
uniref:Origin recognition complex subunit 1 n=1 Tax=Stegastes partitus TaxID=144197 RepID=A0A3B5A526_9TELE